LNPAAKFLDELPDKLRAKATRSIGLLHEFGPYLREPHAKKVTNWQGLFELRVALGSDACRFFYFWQNTQYVVITSGYVKKDMKLDRKELDKAASLMKLYHASEGEDQ